MKIMVLSSYAPTLFYFREDMMKAMIKSGHEVVAAAPEPSEKWEKKFNKRNIKYLSIEGIERTGTNPLSDLKGFISILKAIKREKPDKIISYQAKTIIYGSIAAKLLGVKEIFVLMGGLGSVFRNDEKSMSKEILKIEYKITFKICNNIFFQNKDDRESVVKAGLVKESKTVMINGSGVNLDNFKAEKIPENPVFLFIGRIIKDKGVMEYLEAAKIVKMKYPQAKIQIAGYFDTNPTAIKEDVIYEYVNKDIIEYLGATDDVRPFLKKSTVYVLPSYHEGTPKSVLEAMATGRPIITSDAPGCRETVREGVNGFLVPIKNSASLAEKMIWMIEHKEAADKMGNESLRMCKEKFDVNKVNKVILSTMGIKNEVLEHEGEGYLYEHI